MKDCLHESNQAYAIYLAQRDKNNSDRFQAAVDKALPPAGQATDASGPVVSKLAIVLSSEYPELSIVDYWLWALQRYIFKEESCFFKALENRYSVIVDIYAALEVNNAQQNLQLVQRAYELSQQVYRNQQQQYALGALQYADLLTTERSLLSTEQNYINATYSYLAAKLSYEVATGAL